MDKKRRQVIASHEISELRTYKLGGFEQKVVIDGKKKSNPIVIFLHGGPGSPIPFGEGCRGMFPEITEELTFVFWDQLGCGINDCAIDDSFTISHFADMTLDLIRQIKSEFLDNQLILFGVSWGSILAAKAALGAPELIDRVVVYGQVLRQLGYCEEVFSALWEVKMSPKDKKTFTKIEENRKNRKLSLDDIKSMMGFIRKYTEGYQAKAGGKTPIGKILAGLLESPDYSFRDFKAVAVNGYRKNSSLLMELMKLDLSDTLQKVQIPYLIMQGSTDIVTPTAMIERYMAEVKNENLRLEIVADSGHMPSAKGMEQIVARVLGR